MQIAELYTKVNAKLKADGFEYSPGRFVYDISVIQCHGGIVIDGTDVRLVERKSNVGSD